MKTVGYVRVSTDKQADQGVSLDAQAEKIRAMAVVHGADLVDIIVDGGESAKSLKRPGMAKLLAMVDAGKVQTVIIAKLDRLTRSVKGSLRTAGALRTPRCGAGFGCRVAGHRLRRRTPGAEHYGRRFAMGEGSYRRAYAGRPEAQAQQRRAGRQHRV